MKSALEAGRKRPRAGLWGQCEDAPGLAQAPHQPVLGSDPSVWLRGRGKPASLQTREAQSRPPTVIDKPVT